MFEIWSFFYQLLLIMVQLYGQQNCTARQQTKSRTIRQPTRLTFLFGVNVFLLCQYLSTC